MLKWSPPPPQHSCLVVRFVFHYCSLNNWTHSKFLEINKERKVKGNPVSSGTRREVARAMTLSSVRHGALGALAV